MSHTARSLLDFKHSPVTAPFKFHKTENFSSEASEATKKGFSKPFSCLRRLLRSALKAELNVPFAIPLSRFQLLLEINGVSLLESSEMSD
jgi:hypothetical protein